MIYYSSSYCLVRTPLLPKNYPTSSVQISSLSKREIKLLEEGILIASLDFFREFKKETKINSEKRILTFEKYYNRSTCRCTPFGIFAGIAFCEFKEYTYLELDDPEKFKKHVLVSPYWLLSFIEKIEQDICIKYPQSNLILNNRLHHIGNKLYLTPSSVEDSETSVTITPLLNFVLQLTKKPLTVTEIIDRISIKFNVNDYRKTAFYLQDLLNKNFLITTLRETVTNQKDSLSYLLRELKSIDFDYYTLELLVKVKNTLKIYQDKTLGEGINYYLEIHSLLNTILQTKVSPLKVDMELCFKKGPSLSHHIKVAIEEAAEVLSRFAYYRGGLRKKAFDIFRSKFTEKYGSNQLVKLQDVLHEVIGIGYPNGYLNSVVNEEKIKQEEYPFHSVYLKYLDSLTTGDPLELEDDDLPKLNSDLEINSLPDSMEIYAEILANNIENLDKDDFYIQLNHMCNTASIGQSGGRFSYLLGDKYLQLIKKDLDELTQFEEDTITVELTEYPKNKIMANVMNMNKFSKTYLALGIKGDILLEDIYLASKADKLYLFSKKLGKKLLFQVKDLANIQSLSPLYRFLIEISREGKIFPNGFSFPELDIWPFRPRVIYKHVILRPATWLLNKKAIKNKCTIDQFKSLFFEVSKRWHIPYEFFLVNGDNRLLLAPAGSDTHLKILYREWLKQEFLLLNENIYGEFDGHKHFNSILKGTNGFYFSEIVVPVRKKVSVDNQERYSSIPNYIWKQEDNLETLKDWLYFELKVAANQQESFLINEFKNLIQTVQYKCCKWFFMRYMIEGADIIRLRFKANPQILHDIYQYYLDWYEETSLVGKISEYKILPYVREKARYGGKYLIEEIETFFHSESILTVTLLEFMQSKYNDAIEKEIILAYLIYEIFCVFKVDITVSSLYTKQSGNREKIHKYRKKLLLFLKGGSFSIFEEDKLLKKYWKKHLEQAKILEKKLERCKGKLTNSKEDIVNSLIHMQCNRLFGINKDKEMLVRAVFNELEMLKKYL